MLHEAENLPLVLKDLNIFEARYFEATAKGFCFCNFVAASIMRGFKMLGSGIKVLKTNL